MQARPDRRSAAELLVPNRTRGETWYRALYCRTLDYLPDGLVSRRRPLAVTLLRVAAATLGYNGANLDAALSVQAQTVAFLPNGTPVAVSAVVVGRDTGNWSRVTCNGLRGYVYSPLLRR